MVYKTIGKVYRVKEALGTRLVLASNVSKIFTWIPIAMAVFIVILTTYFVVAAGGLDIVPLIIVVICCFILLIIAFRVMWSEVYIFDRKEGVLVNRKENLGSRIGITRNVEKTFQLSDLKTDWGLYGLDAKKVFVVSMKDQALYWFFFRGSSGHKQSMERLINQFFTEEGLGSDDEEITAIQQMPITKTSYQLMQNEIRSWGISSMVLGVVHLVSSGLLNPSWGITLLVVGLISFFVSEAAMFVLYAVTLIWVGLSNAVWSEFGFWTLFGVYQIYLGLRLFKKYKRFKQAEEDAFNTIIEDEIEMDGVQRRAAKYFPGVGCGLSTFALFCFVGLFLFAIVLSVETPEPNIANVINFIFGLLLGFGVIGFGVSLSGVVSKFNPKWMVWIGVACGGMMILIDLAFRFI